MKKLLPFVALGVALFACNSPKPESAITATAEAKTAPTEFADSTYVNTCKQGLASLASGDVDGFTNNLAENAVYQWNAGDSLSGKNAIVTYWKERRGNVIDKLNINRQIWLAIKVNESKQTRTGVWVFAWANITASYKGGKSMSQWIHNVYHFDPTGKIDQIVQFLDRVPIAAALPPKK